MFSSMDKALIALVMALVYLANYFHIFTFNIDPANLGALITALTPFLVYFFPNKQS